MRPDRPELGDGLRLIVVDGERERVHDLQAGPQLIGSGDDCAVRVAHPAVSRRHARLAVDEDGAALTDLGSSNGTFVAGRRTDGTVRLESAAAPHALGFGPVVARLEAVAAGDRETAIALPSPAVVEDGATETRRRGRTETTISTASIQRLVIEMLPRWLDALDEGLGALAMAQRVGASLFDTLPVRSVELVLRGDGSEVEDDRGGVAFRASRGAGDDRPQAAAGSSAEPEDADATEISLERARIGCRVLFVHALQARAYRGVVESAVRFVELAGGGERAREVREEPPPLPEPVTVEPAVRRLYADAAKVARGDVSVLITGESGTGKEVLAHYLHRASARRDHAFVALNCAALPRDLLESELFGIDDGVATGVRARAGCFERADGGTLFLDEIGDMAPETQARILRVLQEGTVYRLGGRKPTSADVRILAATNRPIDELLERGAFRGDLYHRVADWRVELPPLRARRGDIGNLAAHFLAESSRERGIVPAGLSRRAVELLEAYPWPGNIRQLEREIARAVLFLESGQLLQSHHLQDVVRRGAEPEATTLKERLERAEREILEAEITRHGGDVPRAAEALSIGRSTLYRRIRELGLEI
ncbi:MAG: sigma 54-interacting transcriptional regulator [Acidobacteriota bacterium]